MTPAADKAVPATPPAKPKPLPEPVPVATEPMAVMALRIGENDDIEAASVHAAELAKATGALVVVLVGKTRLEALDEDAMAKYGWVRAETKPVVATDLVRVVAP